MKINNQSSKLGGVNNTQSQALNKNGKSEKGASLENAKGLDDSAKVNLSRDAQAFQKAKDIASKTEVDNEKVERLQKLIDAGKYNVDAKAVADRLVDEHLKLNS